MLARCLPGYQPATTYRGLNQPGLNRFAHTDLVCNEETRSVRMNKLEHWSKLVGYKADTGRI